MGSWESFHFQENLRIPEIRLRTRVENILQAWEQRRTLVRKGGVGTRQAGAQPVGFPVHSPLPDAVRPRTEQGTAPSLPLSLFTFGPHHLGHQRKQCPGSTRFCFPRKGCVDTSYLAVNVNTTLTAACSLVSRYVPTTGRCLTLTRIVIKQNLGSQCLPRSQLIIWWGRCYMQISPTKHCQVTCHPPPSGLGWGIICNKALWCGCEQIAIRQIT